MLRSHIGWIVAVALFATAPGCGKKEALRELTAEEVSRYDSWAREICDCEGQPDPKECSKQVRQRFDLSDRSKWPDLTTLSEASRRQIDPAQKAGTDCDRAIWDTKM